MLYTLQMPKFACPFCQKTFDDSQKRGSHISSGHRGPDRDRYLKLPLAERIKKVVSLPGPGPANEENAPIDSSALASHLKESIAEVRAALAKVEQERARLSAQLEVLESLSVSKG